MAPAEPTRRRGVGQIGRWHGELRRMAGDRGGATAVEYGLIAAIISVAVVAGLTPLGGSIKETMLTVANSLNNSN